MSIGALEPLILASASAARARLLQAAGIAVRIEAAAIDESEIKAACRSQGRDAAACAGALAEAKARAVSARHRDGLVIGADQMLDCDGTWLDKPRDVGEARAQLERLRGRRHELVTAATVLAQGDVAWRRIDRARLTMRRCSDAFLGDYVAAMGGELTATVGGYFLEGLGAQLFDEIEGDYFAILGLPLVPLLSFLRGRGAIAQ
jgi:septum formation protein